MGEKKKFKPLKGYNNCFQLTKRNLKKISFDGPIGEMVNREEFITHAMEVLENGGVGFYYKRKKQVLSLFLFRVEMIATDEKKKIFQEKPCHLVLDTEMVIPEYENQYYTMKDELIASSKDYIMTHDVKEVHWSGETYVRSHENVHFGPFTIPTYLLCFCAGALFGWAIFKNITMVLCFGLIYGNCLGTSMKLITSGNSKMIKKDEEK